MRALKMRSIVAGHRKLTMTNWEQSSKLILLQLYILCSFSIWSKLEKWKGSISGYLMSWPEIKKIVVFEVSSSSIVCNNDEPFLDWCVMKSGFYMTGGDDQFSGWTEKKLQSTSQSQTWTKKRSWSLFGGLLPVWSTTSFLNPGKTITSEKYAQQLTRWTEKCNACSQHWSIESAQCLNARHTPTLQKLNELGYKVLPHPLYSPDLFPINYHFFKQLGNFLQGKHLYNQQEAENAFPEFSESRSMDFYCIGISKFISHWQKMCWL